MKAPREVISRVPVEIWTKVVVELLNSNASAARDDPPGYMSGLAKAWKACRPVCRKMKAATEDAFTQHLLADANNTNTLLKVSHIDKTTIQHFHHTRTAMSVVTFDRLSRTVGPDNELRLVWKINDDRFWDQPDEVRITSCEYILSPGQWQARAEDRSGFAGFASRYMNSNRANQALLTIGKLSCFIKLPGLVADVPNRELSFPWVRVLCRMFSRYTSPERDHWVLVMPAARFLS